MSFFLILSHCSNIGIVCMQDIKNLRAEEKIEDQDPVRRGLVDLTSRVQKMSVSKGADIRET